MLKIGILGASLLAEKNLRQLRELQEFEITGIFDLNYSEAQALAQKLNIKPFDSIKSLLDTSDAIYFCQPVFGHYEIAIEAIKGSKHIYIEKPVSLTLDETFNLLKLSNEAHLKVQVAFPERFNPAFSSAKTYFNNPMFIETHRLATFNGSNADIPVIYELMVNDIDILLSSIKSNVKKISASGVAIVSNTYDIANARIEFDNGCVANITSSRISLQNMSKSRIFQKDAYITLDFLNNCLNIIRLKDSNENDFSGTAIKIGNKEVAFEKPATEKNNIFRDELVSFHNCIVNDTTPVVSIEDSYNALLVTEKILEKMKLTSNCS